MELAGVEVFTLAGDIDPTYAAAYAEARAAGVETLCYDCRITPEGVWLGGAVRVDIP